MLSRVEHAVDEAGGHVGGGQPRGACATTWPSRPAGIAARLARHNSGAGNSRSACGRFVRLRRAYARRWKVPMRMWLCCRRTSTAERVGEGSSPRSSASPVSISEKVLRGLDAERLQHLGGEHLAHAALQRQPAVAEAAVRRLARALGAEVEQPARAVAQLREQEAAAVADVGVVHAELVAVIAQRQRLREVVRQRLEAAEMADPLLVAQPVEPDRRRRAVVAEAQDRLREIGRRDRIVEIVAELEDRRFGPVRGGLRKARPSVDREAQVRRGVAWLDGPMAIGCRAMA